MIMFAIRATLKIGLAAKEAYIQSTRERPMLLPPAFAFKNINTKGANAFFRLDKSKKRFLKGETGQAHPQAKHIEDLVKKYKKTSLDEGEANLFIDYCKECKRVLDLEKGIDWEEKIVPSLKSDEAMALVTLNTWTIDGAEKPEWWKNFGEVLFDVGLEYAMTNPNICNSSTTTGQAMKTFLGSLEEYELATLEAKDIPSALLITTLDVAATHPGIIIGGENGQKILGATIKSLSKDIDKRLQECEPTDRDNVREWGQLVFRSMLTSAGRLAVEEPGTYLGIHGEKSEAMASAIGGALLDVILGTETGTINLTAVFNGPGIEAITRAALKVVAKHPDIAIDTDNEGIRGLVSVMANDLAAMNNTYSKEALPEVLHLLLENTAENLELIWPNPDNPQKHLFVTAAGTTLRVLARKPANAKWGLAFSHTDAVEVVQSVFEELKANPAWLAGDDPAFTNVLEVILDQTLIVIREKGGDELTRDAAKAIISAALGAALSRVEFTENSPTGATTETFMKACLEVILSTIFQTDDLKVKCQLTRDLGLDALLAVTFDSLERADLGSPEEKTAALATLKTVRGNLVEDLKKGKGIDFTEIETTLARTA